MKMLFTYIAAGLSGLAASACCWIPALLGAGAAGSLGVSAALAPYRPLFLILTGLFLAVGFYVVYRSPAGCRDGCCDASSTPKRRARIGVMWIVAAIAVASATYPYMIQASHTRQQAAVAPAMRDKVVISVTGMDCPACAVPIEEQLRKVPGVVAAELDYDRSIVVVGVSEPRPEPRELLRTIEEIGFGARLVETKQEESQ